jgi:hypothetical protein
VPPRPGWCFVCLRYRFVLKLQLPRLSQRTPCPGRPVLKTFCSWLIAGLGKKISQGPFPKAYRPQASTTFHPPYQPFPSDHQRASRPTSAQLGACARMPATENLEATFLPATNETEETLNSPGARKRSTHHRDRFLVQVATDWGWG